VSLVARPPLALGRHGTITTKREDGRWVARCRVRDLDGVTRRVARWGKSKAAAQHALQDDLRRRHGERAETLRQNSRFRDAADVWLKKIAEKRADSTLDIYTHWLNKLVLPQLGELRLAECDIASIDAFFSRLERARRTVRHKDGTYREAALLGEQPAHRPQHRLRNPPAGRAAPGHRLEPRPGAGAHRVAEGARPRPSRVA
jgi:hypothetical protein